MNGRWDRIEGVVDVEELSRKHVVVVGLGSGGSTVALELAKAGVGRFTLVDPDVLESRNLIRHECDGRYLGSGKAASLAELIFFRNPEAEVDVLPVDVFSLGARLQNLVASADVVAGCTDTESPKNLLNRHCLRAGVPAIYAGVYERGVGGEVIRCDGGPDDPCYACVTSVLKDAAPLPTSDGALDYGAPIDGALGLGLDVRLVALLHSKVCLDTLLGRELELPGNVVLFGNEVVEGLFSRPFASAVLKIAPQADCLVCAPQRRFASRAT